MKPVPRYHQYACREDSDALGVISLHKAQLLKCISDVNEMYWGSLQTDADIMEQMLYKKQRASTVAQDKSVLEIANHLQVPSR